MPKKDSLGRRRTDAQERAIASINAERKLEGRERTKSARFNLPPDLVPLFNSLDIAERSHLLERALGEFKAGRWALPE